MTPMKNVIVNAKKRANARKFAKNLSYKLKKSEERDLIQMSNSIQMKAALSEQLERIKHAIKCRENHRSNCTDIKKLVGAHTYNPDYSSEKGVSATTVPTRKLFSIPHGNVEQREQQRKLEIKHLNQYANTIKAKLNKETNTHKRIHNIIAHNRSSSIVELPDYLQPISSKPTSSKPLSLKSISSSIENISKPNSHLQNRFIFGNMIPMASSNTLPASGGRRRITCRKRNHE